MQGKMFLKVCGIIMIVFGAIAFFVSGIAGVIGALGAAFEAAIGESVGAGTLIIASIISIVASILELICGIIGVANCEKPEKADLCFKWGIIVIAVQLVSFIFGIIASGFSIVSLISFILPGLFLYGAYLNKQQAA